MNIHTLTRHRDIQNWVNDRSGQPAIKRMPNQFGEVRARLMLSFAKAHPRPTSTPSQDDGMSPVSWAAWLAELDRQNLALKVSDQSEDYEFVERRSLN